jgi:chromosome segregation ATPase
MSMNDRTTSSPEGSLERLGIPVEVPIDENVLLPSKAKAITFRISRPTGYAFSEVDDYVQNIVNPSIEWLVHTIATRNRDVHALGEQLDLAEVDIKNLQGQIQYLQYNSTLAEGINRNSDDKEAAALMEKLTKQELEIASLRNQIQAAKTQGTDPETEAYIQQITDQYNDLLTRYDNDVNILEAQLVEAQASVATAENTSEQEEYIAQLTAQYGDLQTQYTEELASFTAQLAEKDEALAVALKRHEEDTVKLQEQLQQLLDAPKEVGIDPETEAYIQQITNQYTELVSRYETDTAELQARLEEASATPEDAIENAELVTHIEDITNRYNELSERYKADTEDLNNQLQVAKETVPTSVTDPAIDEYIEQITAQYGELVSRYETDTTALQEEIAVLSNAAPQTVNVDNSAEVAELSRRYEELLALHNEEKETAAQEYATLKEYADSLDAHITLLEQQLNDSDEAHEIEENRPAMILPTEAKKLAEKRPDLADKYANLPQGIRPDDLE